MNHSQRRSMTALLSIIMLTTVALPTSHAGPAHSSQTATPSPTPAPGFRISLTNNVSQITSGDKLTYTVTAVNTSSTDATGIQIRLILPSGVASTDPHGGIVDKQYVTWSTDLAAGKETTHAAAVTLDHLATGNNGLAVVACVLTGPQHQPLVCASDIDQLRGVPDIHGTTATAIPWLWWLLAGGILLLVLAILAFLIIGRRRRHRTGNPRAAKPDDRG